MTYKQKYFDSGQEFSKKKLLYRIRDSLPIKETIRKKSQEHYTLLLKDKWKYFKGCQSVLDAGCGKGQFIKKAPKKTKVAGVDFIEGEITELKKEGYDVKVADLTKKIPYKDSSFDGIYCSHVLEHIEDPTTIIAECKRVLKKNGVLVIAVPNFSFKQFYADYTHKRPYPKEALFRLLNDNNFTKIQVVNGVGFIGFISGLFLFTPKIRRSLEKLIGVFKPWERIAIARNQK